MRRALAALGFGAALLGATAAAAPPAAPSGGPTTAATAPLLAWGDDPPAVEVRSLAGSRTITVRYGALAPATFFAELDGEPVTALFAPAPGATETVELPFIGGRNDLRLGASDATGLEHIVLERSVVFARLPGDAASDARLRSAPELKHEVWKKQTPEAQPVTVPADAPAPAPPTGPAPVEPRARR